jgi:hypothetical protein
MDSNTVRLIAAALGALFCVGIFMRRRSHKA